MLPGPGTLDSAQKLRRGEGLDDYISGLAGMMMAGAARPGLSAGRAAIANKNAATAGFYAAQTKGTGYGVGLQHNF